MRYNDKMLNPWLIPDSPPQTTDCFIALSYTVKNKSVPTKPTQAVVDLTYEYWKKFPKAKVIVSTGDNQGLGVTNAQVMKEYLIKIGMPENAIIKEDRSMNTCENLKYSWDIAKKRGCNYITLVTLDLHARRTAATANKLGMQDFNWISAYAKGDRAYGKKYLQTYSRFTILVYEVLAYWYSRLRRWV